MFLRSSGRRKHLDSVGDSSYRSKSSTFLGLAEQQKFDDIVRILLGGGSDGLRSWLLEDDRSVNNDLKNVETPLHRIMPYRPPAAVVDLLIQRLTEMSLHPDGCCPEDLVDSKGRTPLHVAAAEACDLAVVRRLISSSGKAVQTRDLHLRYPLHWACSNPRGASSVLRRGKSTTYLFSKSSSANKSNDARNMLEVIAALVLVYPKAVLWHDKDGRTPLDIARERHASEMIVRLLERVVEIGVDKFVSTAEAVVSRKIMSQPTNKRRGQPGTQPQDVTDSTNVDNLSSSSDVSYVFDDESCSKSSMSDSRLSNRQEAERSLKKAVKEIQTKHNPKYKSTETKGASRTDLYKASNMSHQVECTEYDAIKRKYTKEKKINLQSIMKKQTRKSNPEHSQPHIINPRIRPQSSSTSIISGHASSQVSNRSSSTKSTRNTSHERKVTHTSEDHKQASPIFDYETERLLRKAEQALQLDSTNGSAGKAIGKQSLAFVSSSSRKLGAYDKSTGIRSQSTRMSDKGINSRISATNLNPSGLPSNLNHDTVRSRNDQFTTAVANKNDNSKTTLPSFRVRTHDLDYSLHSQSFSERPMSVRSDNTSSTISRRSDSKLILGVRNKRRFKSRESESTETSKFQVYKPRRSSRSFVSASSQRELAEHEVTINTDDLDPWEELKILNIVPQANEMELRDAMETLESCQLRLHQKGDTSRSLLGIYC